MKQRKIILISMLAAALGFGALVGYWRWRPRVVTLPEVSTAPRVNEQVACVDFHEVEAHAGETGCVSGRIIRVFNSRAGNTFLDFCTDYRTCPFTSVIFASDKRKFGDLESLAGRQVEIRGPITVYQGRTQIIIHDPQQIRTAP